MDVVVQHSRKQVVCRADGMEVAGEMKVDILHGNNLGITAAGCTALNAENGTERGLSKCYNGILANATKAIGKTDGGRGLTLTRGSGGNRSNKNQLSVLFFCVLQKRKINFGFIFSVILKITFIYMCGLSDLADMLHFASLRNFDVCKISHCFSPYLKYFTAEAKSFMSYSPGTFL